MEDISNNIINIHKKAYLILSIMNHSIRDSKMSINQTYIYSYGYINRWGEWRASINVSKQGLECISQIEEDDNNNHNNALCDEWQKEW